VKARKVKGLDPAGTLADNAERIVRTRLDELCGFMPRAADPTEVTALHDMRIAAKRLRYILEVTGPVFGEYTDTAVKLAKALQDLLGEIHDCDEQGPAVAAVLEELIEDDARTLAERHAAKEDLDPAAVRRAPNHAAYSGVAALLVHLRARRALLFGNFLELWADYERKGFRARLEYAITERSQPRTEASPAAAIISSEP
jgi:CHAD domain-containing protein